MLLNTAVHWKRIEQWAGQKLLRARSMLEVQERNGVASPLHLGASLAKPLSNASRNRIMAELVLRPMSPNQFSKEFEGPALPVVARYFRELKDWGLLEVATELRGGKRRGAVEKVYRAARPIYFDTPSWEELPYYLRCECSASLIEGLVTRITGAIKAKALDADEDRHISWKAIRLDRTAWSDLVSRLDQVLEWTTELEAESASRTSGGREERFPGTLGLLSFRSPASPVGPAEADSKEGQGQSDTASIAPHFIMRPATAKVLANPWRNQILTELYRRPMSPKQFIEEFDGPDLATTARYFRQLKKWGYLEVVDELRGGARRGSVEKVYRAIKRVHFSTTGWETLPHSLKKESPGSTLDGLMKRINEAVDAGTFDAETDRHLSWRPMYLDRQAWAECVTQLDEVCAWIYELEAESVARLERSEGEEIPATVGLTAFRSPDGESL
jgi:hypothetical protein